MGAIQSEERRKQEREQIYLSIECRQSQIRAAQLAIDKAEAGDFGMVNDLLQVLRQPYAEHPENVEFAQKRPEWARHRVGGSMLSCSS